jgi:hypothetical protein
MTIGLGLALSIGLCYYVNRRQAQKSSSRLNYLKRQHLQASSLSMAEAADKTQTLVDRDAGGRATAVEFAARTPIRNTTDSQLYQDYYSSGQRRYQPRQTPDTSLVAHI